MIKRIAILAALLLTAASCVDKDQVDPAFMAFDGLGLSIAGQQAFLYDALTCQYSFNREKKEFRLQTDTTSDYVIALLSDIPAEKGQKLTGELRWTTERDVKSKRAALKVIKIENGTVWLWNRNERIGLTVRIPD